MPSQNPPNAENVRHLLEERLQGAAAKGGLPETLTIEWRGAPTQIPVVSMPVNLLQYNPDTHRIRAQRSMDLAQEEELIAHPYSTAAQAYLHKLLMGDPSDPSKIDPSFTGLKDDLKAHGQREPGIVNRAGVLINGNTRQAALKAIGIEHIRVGVLPADAGHDDMQSVELSLQLRKDHRREYSFMNFLLAVDERTTANQPNEKVLEDFHIKQFTLDRSRWLLEFVRDAIRRSSHKDDSGRVRTLSLVHFETHQGKLEELHRAYAALKPSHSDKAEALREQRLLALILDKSKTDLRLIDPEFMTTYMKGMLSEVQGVKPAGVKIPGTSISVSGPSAEVAALRELTTKALQAKTVALNPEAARAEEIPQATNFLNELNDKLIKGLDQAGKQVRLQRRKFAAADRLSDAGDDLDLAIGAVREARATGNFDPADLDEALLNLKSLMNKLSAIVNRASESRAEGQAWLRAVANIDDGLN